MSLLRLFLSSTASLHIKCRLCTDSFRTCPSSCSLLEVRNHQVLELEVRELLS
jgi:hypothetical protein